MYVTVRRTGRRLAARRRHVKRGVSAGLLPAGIAAHGRVQQLPAMRPPAVGGDSEAEADHREEATDRAIDKVLGHVAPREFTRREFLRACFELRDLAIE